MMHADGWVTENGRILHEGEPRPGSYSIHPATRDDWIGECSHRLAAANAFRATPGSFENACRAWLAYYEQTGATQHGYSFDYAIPVAISTITVPCVCPPPPVPPRHKPAPRPLVRDKRVKIIRY